MAFFPWWTLHYFSLSHNISCKTSDIHMYQGLKKQQMWLVLYRTLSTHSLLSVYYLCSMLSNFWLDPFWLWFLCYSPDGLQPTHYLCQNLQSLSWLPIISPNLEGHCVEFDLFGNTFCSWNWLASRWSYTFQRRQAREAIPATHAFFAKRPLRYCSHFRERYNNTCPVF